jgi:phosphoglycolate phosphatase-like HAD superfamily hydrolase
MRLSGPPAFSLVLAVARPPNLSPMKLLLFDIDGTLLRTHGVGRRSIETALTQLSGQPITTDGIHFSGKTDPQILREILANNEVPAEARAALIEQAMAAYVDIARRLLSPKRVTVMPGVDALLAHLAARNDVTLGLLTGNLEPTAYLKLEAASLAHHFPFGAFGSDDADRYRLPPVAVERARQHTGHDFVGRDVVIIGDTEHDVRCGRGIGAFSVAVCTGRYDRAALARHDPDVLFDDLRDAETFFRLVVDG